MKGYYTGFASFYAGVGLLGAVAGAFNYIGVQGLLVWIGALIFLFALNQCTFTPREQKL